MSLKVQQTTINGAKVVVIADRNGGQVIHDATYAARIAAFPVDPTAAFQITSPTQVSIPTTIDESRTRLNMNLRLNDLPPVVKHSL